MRPFIGITLLATVLSTFGNALAQQAWPTKPVRLVVANSPGAATDLACRVFADSLSRIVGQPVTVENRPGADGYIGAEAVAKAPPDGHTMFFGSQSVFAIDPNIKRTMPVDPQRDLTPVAVMIDDTGATGIFAHPSMPFTTFPEMLAHAKANPGKLTYATVVPLFGMMGAFINKRAGINLVEVRYKNTAQANQDAIAGTVSMILTAFGPFEQYLRAGRVRVLAVTRRVDDWPQIPVLNEFFPDYSQPSFVVLAGPGGMPSELLQRINRAAAAVVENPKFNQDLKKVRWRNLEGARTPEGTVEFIRQRREDWARFVKEIGLTPS